MATVKQGQIELTTAVMIVIGIVGGGLLIYFLFFAPAKQVTPVIKEYNFTKLNYTRVYFPNKTLTPGMIMSSNITEICVPGYSERVRSVSDSTKTKVYNSYRLQANQTPGSYQIDEVIPLCLGGSNDIKNLWPEPANPKPGYMEKDRLENYLCDAVCNGSIDLRQAQGEINENWFETFMKYGL